MTLKVRNQDFSIATCQTYVDLPNFFFLWKSAIFHSIKPPFDAEVAEKNLEWYLIHMYISKWMPTKRQSDYSYTMRHKDSSSKNLNKSPSALSPNNVFHSYDSRSHSSRTASVMKVVQRSKNSYLSNWFDYHDSSFSGFFEQSYLHTRKNHV